MRFTVHDVGHGQCISLIQGNQAMLWDCGSDSWFKPSDFFHKSGINEISLLTITNYDEDHISNLPDLIDRFGSNKIKSLLRNKSISSDQLRRLKRQSGDISPAMESLLNMMNRYTASLSPQELNEREKSFPNVSRSVFYNSYGSGNNQFNDTNNISVVTFLTIDDLKIVIPGDLEKSGWQTLLKNKRFCQELRETNCFIASHHGRENGFCEDVFSYCKPKIIIFSDDSIKYGTQERMSEIYGQFASGLRLRNGQTRKVITTRNDGDFYINIQP